MFSAYVISDETGRFYKGHTEDMERRLAEHNSGSTKSTRGSVKWQVVYKEEFSSREEARAREKYFKTAAGRRFIKNKLVP